MRHGLVALVLALLCEPLVIAAQQPTRLVRIGFLSAASPANDQLHEAFVEGLREHGYVHGRNLALESRWADGQVERLPGLAAASRSLQA